MISLANVITSACERFIQTIVSILGEMGHDFTLSDFCKLLFAFFLEFLRRRHRKVSMQGPKTLNEQDRVSHRRRKPVDQRESHGEEKLSALRDSLDRVQVVRSTVKFRTFHKPTFANRNIVLAEDEQVLQYYGSVLEEEIPGIRVHVAPNGAEALAKIKAFRPSLLITDIVLPGLNGFELITKVRESYPHMHVLAISAYMDNESQIMHEIGKLPFNFKFVPKPISLATFLSAVSEMLPDHGCGGRFDDKVQIELRA